MKLQQEVLQNLIAMQLKISNMKQNVMHKKKVLAFNHIARGFNLSEDFKMMRAMEENHLMKHSVMAILTL